MTNTALFKRFYKYLAPHVKGLLLVFFLLIVSSFGSLASPYALKIIIDTILPKGTFKDLIFVLGVLIVIYIIRIGCNFFTEVLYTKMGQKIIAAIQADINIYVLQKPIDFFYKTKPGDIIFLLMNDVGVIQSSLFLVILKFANDILTLVGIVIMLMILDFKLTSVSLIVIPILLLSSRKFTPLLQLSFKEIQETQEKLNCYFLEVFRNHRVIKSYNTLPYEQDRLNSLHEDVIGLNIKNSILTATNSNVITFLVAVGPIIVLMFGGNKVFSGAITIGSLVAFIQYLNRLYAPAISLANTYNSVNKAMVSMRRIAEFLVPKENKPIDKELQLISDFDTLSFSNVSLTLDHHHILNSINLQFKRGQMVGLSGPSGSGKSTIVNLLCGFLTPTKGEILINDKVSIGTIANWSNNLGLIEKHHQLFDGSIGDNIRYGGWDNSTSGLDDAIRHAEFSSVLEELPEGIETRVTDAGSSLSDGQRQRISIARALFKNAKIIIVDEATSSLDLALETRVIKNIRKHHSDAMLIFITHRVTSLSHCDYVYFIDAGTVVGENSPKNDALMV